MNRDRVRPMRPLTAEERTLWFDATRSVAPLRSSGRSADTPSEVETAGSGRAAATGARATRASHPVRPLPAPTALDRRFKQRLARGREPIDGRIDLHGLKQSEAHHALLGFLRSARGRGAKVVLVITGKGGRDANQSGGVLRRQVPLWLHSAELRDHVAGFAVADSSHGGEGALYVRLRRTRE